MKFRPVVLSSIVALGIGALASLASANEYEPQIRSAFEQHVQTWLNDPAVVEAIKAQNAKHASLTDAEIETMDQDWRAQAKAGSGPLVDQLLSAALSKFLAERKNATNGVITEMFVMDNRGLNVGQSDLTSDYMQGDEAKWQKTFQVGPDAVFVDDVEFDDSAESFQSQISVTIKDPATGEAIGAITVGINVEKLS